MKSSDSKPGLPEDSISLLTYESLAEFQGDPGAFWSQLCEYVRGQLESDSVCLLLRAGGDVSEFRVVAQSPRGASRRLAKGGLNANSLAVESSFFEPLPGPLGRSFEALVLPARDGLPATWVVVENAAGEENRETVAKEIKTLSGIYQARRQARRSEEKLVNLSEVLDLGLALGETSHFNEAAMRVCNELAAQMQASRASLAWLEGQDIKLKATSSGGRISANAEETLSLQQVMEESTDQDNEVSYPELGGSLAINREHRQFSIAHEGVSILSVPFRTPKEAVGAICLERAAEDGKWETGEVERLRLLADLVVARLDELHAKTGWFGRRWWRSIRRNSAKIFGHEHTGWKLTGVLLVLAVLSLALIKMEHKVRAPFILKTDAASLISAPFPGYIEEANYHLGDIVKKDQLLVGLDRKEILLEEADTVALLNKSMREARSFEAEGNLAPMRVALAEKAQAEAKLAIIRHRLALTRITAPFDGVVVEGDLRERLSSPIQTGEPLLKIVQLEDLFGQLQVDDRDISYLTAEAEGELAFTSRPEEKYSVQIDRFEPVAEIRPEGTVFLLRARVIGDSQAWWRPGMSGVCKIDAGKRSLLWIFGHRMVEVIRLRLWI